MARISQETIDRVRNAADILDVVSQYVDLKKRGRNYFGICPFHHEKTPSFSVAPDKEIYHCFGCGKGGNAINFIMEYEKIEFVDAIQKLGQRYGIEVKMEGGFGSTELRSRLYQIHDFAQKVFYDNLHHPSGKYALDYLHKRDLPDDLLMEFGVGFAKDSYNDLLNKVKDAGFTPKEISKSGLFSQTEKGTFDRFHNRIMFPIYDRTGKIVAFGGRTLSKEDPAKYLNSPETQLYKKSDVFYGLHATRKKIREEGFAILVEGYTDFLRLYQAEIQNVVAVSGTALTVRHVQHLGKFTNAVVLLYDGDTAGTNAAIRAAYLLLEGGIEPSIVQPPEGSDPDDWVRNEGAEAVREKLKQAEKIIPFQIRNTEILDKPIQDQSQFVDDILRHLVSINDSLVRTDLIRRLSQHIGMDENDVIKRFQQLIRRSRRRQPQGESQDDPKRIKFNTRSQKAQLELIRILAGSNKTKRDAAKDQIQLEWFTDPLLHKLAKILLPIYDVEIPFSAISEQFSDEAEHRAVTEIFATLPENEEADKILEECIQTLKTDPLREQIKQLRMKIREMEQAGKDATDLAIEVAMLQQEIKLIHG